MKKLILFFLLILLLLPLLVIAVLTIDMYISYYKEKNQTYYFPQIETYIKIRNPPFSKYGYVLLSKDSVFSFSENIDYVKIYKSEVSWISFIFNLSEKNKFYIINRWNDEYVNQVNFIVKTMSVVNLDTALFVPGTVCNTSCTPILKPTYFRFNIDGYLQNVFNQNGDVVSPKEILHAK